MSVSSADGQDVVKINSTLYLNALYVHNEDNQSN